MDEKLEIAVAALLEIAQGSLSLDGKIAAQRALSKIHMLASLESKRDDAYAVPHLDHDLMEMTR